MSTKSGSVRGSMSLATVRVCEQWLILIPIVLVVSDINPRSRHKRSLVSFILPVCVRMIRSV